MKIALFSLALAISANADMNIRGRGLGHQVKQIITIAEKVSMSDSEELLQLDLRRPLMEEIESYIQELTADFIDDRIVKYSCNNIQRKKSIKREDARAADLQTKTNKCVAVLGQLVESSKGKGVVDSLADMSTCAAELPGNLRDLGERHKRAAIYWI